MRRANLPRPERRPSKFTTAVALAIVSAVGRGEPLDVAARLSGIGPSTIYRRLARGRTGDDRFSPLAYAVAQARTAGRYGALVATFGSTASKGKTCSSITILPDVPGHSESATRCNSGPA